MMFAIVTAVVLAGTPVGLEFDGTLKDGLRQLAQKSGINLVVIGELDERVQLNLPNVDGEEALEAIATAYDLEITRKGAASKLWVVKKKAGAVAVLAPLAPPAPPNVLTENRTPQGTVVVVGSPDPAARMRDEAEQARVAADAARAEADSLREKTEAMRNASESVREKLRDQLEAAKEKAREAAEEAREKEQEAAEAAREQAQEAAEAERERAEALKEQAQAQKELARAQIDRHRAELERHRVSAGGPVTVEKETQVDTAVAYGGPVIVEENAVVDGDAVAFGGDVILKKNAVVEGDAVSFGGTVVKEEGAVVHGESVSMGGSGFGTTVARNMIKTQRSARVAEAQDADEPTGGFGRHLASFLLEFAVFFGLGFVLMMFAPQRLKALEDSVRAEPLKNGVAGALAAMASVPLTLLLCVTIVGIPVAIAMWLAAFLLVPAGVAVIANSVGAKLPTGRVRKTQALVLAAGLFALLLALQVPGLNVLVGLVAGSIFVGAAIRTRLGQGPKGTPMIDSLHTSPVL
jgi:hypothetical protein